MQNLSISVLRLWPASDEPMTSTTTSSPTSYTTVGIVAGVLSLSIVIVVVVVLWQFLKHKYAANVAVSAVQLHDVRLPNAIRRRYSLPVRAVPNPYSHGPYTTRL